MHSSVCVEIEGRDGGGGEETTLYNALTPTSKLFQLTVAIIFEMNETGKTTDLPHITDIC
jgi:hypothetical protein